MQVVDCSDTSGRDCIQAEHAANAFDSEKVALMRGLFQMLQAPSGQLLSRGSCFHLMQSNRPHALWCACWSVDNIGFCICLSVCLPAGTVASCLIALATPVALTAGKHLTKGQGMLLAGQEEGHHTQLLSNHVKELNIAAENRFLPILLVPEAVQYRQEQLKKVQQQHNRKHQPAVIRAPAPALDRAPQRELLSVRGTYQNVTAMYSPTRTEPSVFMMFLYTVADLTLHVWYWLPTRQEMLLWLSQYVPVTDVLCMDYFRLTLGHRTLYTNLEEIPLHSLDQALHDAWHHKQQL